jgi:hypothetical protein
MCPKPCFESLVKLNEVSLPSSPFKQFLYVMFWKQMVKLSKLRDAVRNDLFPTADMVVSMSKEFGVPIMPADLEGMLQKSTKFEHFLWPALIAMQGYRLMKNREKLRLKWTHLSEHTRAQAGIGPPSIITMLRMLTTSMSGIIMSVPRLTIADNTRCVPHVWLIEAVDAIINLCIVFYCYKL